MLAILLLLAICGWVTRDFEISRRILGTWKSTSFPVAFTFNPNGNFLTKWSGTDSSSNLTIEGKWKIDDGFVVLNVTNVTGPESGSHPHVGDIERSKIIRIRNNELIYSGDKNVLIAKRE